MYGSASDADLVAGRWYKIGTSINFKKGECPSFYPLPGPTPGFEAEYATLKAQVPNSIVQQCNRKFLLPAARPDPGL